MLLRAVGSDGCLASVPGNIDCTESERSIEVREGTCGCLDVTNSMPHSSKQVRWIA